MKQLDEKMVRQRKEPERRLVTYRLESASKAVVTTASALFLALIVSVWTNCNQYRTNRLLKDADLKYRAIRICLPGDDPDIAFLEKHFTIERDEEKIRRVERLVTAFEDSVRNASVIMKWRPTRTVWRTGCSGRHRKSESNWTIQIQNDCTMATIRTKFRPSSVEGREGTLYFQIIHGRVAR